VAGLQWSPGGEFRGMEFGDREDLDVITIREQTAGDLEGGVGGDGVEGREMVRNQTDQTGGAAARSGRFVWELMVHDGSKARRGGRAGLAGPKRAAMQEVPCGSFRLNTVSSGKRCQGQSSAEREGVAGRGWGSFREGRSSSPGSVGPRSESILKR